ncbi:hypothetical protein EN932_25420, partial [Mesorhizobium sp. M7A.F.Ca.US.002.01.1.1]|uniref:hypothetical protein n=1 Tax=Mesorhizobium sp. M7A.F.Ca.US.002.01.1.1 TaxID=2496700 RepID=UPI000FD38588
MTDKQISDLTAAAALDGTELVHLTQGGNSRKSTVNAVAGWKLAASWTYSTNVANVDFTGLGAFSELLVVIRNITAAASGFRALNVSVD